MSDHIALVEKMYVELARGNKQFVLDQLDPQVEWSAAENFIYADESPYIGPEAVGRGIFSRLEQEWKQFLVIPQEILGSDDVVIARGRYRGTFRATGVSIDAQFVQVFRFKDGKVIAVQSYTDTAQFRDAVQRPRTLATT
jgi:ketosteroid isomerase-like protein